MHAHAERKCEMNMETAKCERSKSLYLIGIRMERINVAKPFLITEPKNLRPIPWDGVSTNVMSQELEILHATVKISRIT
jgi:hypothetical protein